MTAALSRRAFVTLCSLACGAAGCSTLAVAPGRRELDFLIDGSFGQARPADIDAVLRSAASTIWSNCRDTGWELPGFFIYRTPDVPITLHAHRPDGRIAIGLATQDRYWAQYAYQFAHEFAHALAGHSNDWRRIHLGGPRPHLWLEESLCETASLFAIRAMAREWAVRPPYPNWKPFASELERYADQQIAVWRAVGKNEPFARWFERNRAALIAASTDRPRNGYVAIQLLPLFEAQPSGWQALTALNLHRSYQGQPLEERFDDWIRAAAPDERDFIRRVKGVLLRG